MRCRWPNDGQRTTDNEQMTPRQSAGIGILILGLAAFTVIAGASAGDQAPGDRPARATKSAEESSLEAGARPGRKPQLLRGPVEVRRGYQVSLGPWTWRFSVPDSFDPFDIADRMRSVVGMLAILGVAVFLSDDRRAISGRVVLWGLGLQWA